MEKLIRIDPNKFKPSALQVAQRDGIKIDKGAVLTPDYIMKHWDLFTRYAEFFTAYPDLLN